MNLAFGTYGTGCGIARGGIVTVLNPRVHAGLPDLICGAQPARRFNSGELIGAERPDALIVARDVPGTIVESGHKALLRMHPALVEDETSYKQSCTAPRTDATVVGTIHRVALAYLGVMSSRIKGGEAWR